MRTKQKSTATKKENQKPVHKDNNELENYCPQFHKKYDEYCPQKYENRHFPLPQ